VASLSSIFGVALCYCAFEYESIKYLERAVPSNSRRDCLVNLHLTGALALLSSMPWLLPGLWLLGACRLRNSAPVHPSSPPVGFFAYQDSAMCVPKPPQAGCTYYCNYAIQLENTFITIIKVIIKQVFVE